MYPTENGEINFLAQSNWPPVPIIPHDEPKPQPITHAEAPFTLDFPFSHDQNDQENWMVKMYGAEAAEILQKCNKQRRGSSSSSSDEGGDAHDNHRRGRHYDRKSLCPPNWMKQMYGRKAANVLCE